MALASSVATAPASFAGGVSQLRLQQAQRNAEQAEQRARALRAEAESAQHSAQREQERARGLNVDAQQAQGRAGDARRGVAALQSLDQFGQRIGQAYEKIAQAQAQAPAPAVPPPEPVVNTQGEVTGQVVNVAA
jgi:hypothetical protein